MKDRNKIVDRGYTASPYGHTVDFAYCPHLVRAIDHEYGACRRPCIIRMHAHKWSNPEQCNCGLYDGYCPMCGGVANAE